MSDDIDLPDDEGGAQDFGGWLTAPEASEELGGVNPSTITRKAKDGELRREKGPDGRWRYDPDSPALVAAREAREVGVSPGAESVLHGSAAVNRTLTELVVKMAEKLLKGQEQTIMLNERMASSLLQQLKRSDERNSQVENLQLELIKAREEALSAAAERDLAARQAEHSMQMKEQALGRLIENAPALIELALAFTSKTSEANDAEPPSKVEPCSTVE